MNDEKEALRVRAKEIIEICKAGFGRGKAPWIADVIADCRGLEDDVVGWLSSPALIEADKAHDAEIINRALAQAMAESLVEVLKRETSES